MIEAEQSVLIEAGIETVWHYVKDMQKWAALMPGYRECTPIDANDSRWTLKVGVGGLVRTVRVLVHVDEWHEPTRVSFAYRLDGDPVQGSGSYTALQMGPGATQVALRVSINGNGPMALMWEAMSRPLLPKLANSFAEKLKAEIEATPAASERAPVER